MSLRWPSIEGDSLRGWATPAPAHSGAWPLRTTALVQPPAQQRQQASGWEEKEGEGGSPALTTMSFPMALSSWSWLGHFGCLIVTNLAGVQLPDQWIEKLWGHHRFMILLTDPPRSKHNTNSFIPHFQLSLIRKGCFSLRNGVWDLLQKGPEGAAIPHIPLPSSLACLGLQVLPYWVPGTNSLSENTVLDK